MTEERCLVCDATDGIDTLRMTSTGGLNAEHHFCVGHMEIVILSMGFVLGEMLKARNLPRAAARWAERFEDVDRGEFGPITGDELAAFFHMVQLDVIAAAADIVKRATPDKLTRSAVTNLQRSTLLELEQKIRALGKAE